MKSIAEGVVKVQDMTMGSCHPCGAGACEANSLNIKEGDRIMDVNGQHL